MREEANKEVSKDRLLGSKALSTTMRDANQELLEAFC
jgi:hypothetical protein